MRAESREESTISLKRIHCLRWCFENIILAFVKHLAATPINQKMFALSTTKQKKKEDNFGFSGLQCLSLKPLYPISRL